MGANDGASGHLPAEMRVRSDGLGDGHLMMMRGSAREVG